MYNTEKSTNKNDDSVEILKQKYYYLYYVSPLSFPLLVSTTKKKFTVESFIPCIFE